jgi:hypothetical protein
MVIVTAPPLAAFCARTRIAPSCARTMCSRAALRDLVGTDRLPRAPENPPL